MRVELEQLRAAYASKDDEASKVRYCALYSQHVFGSDIGLCFSGPLTFGLAACAPGCKTGRLACVLGLGPPCSSHADSKSFRGPAQDKQA
jgi:hypothetical protein